MTIPSNGAFRALAYSTRRDILAMLRSGTRTSGEIAARFDSSWPTISSDLSVLRDADLVLTECRQDIYDELNTSVFQDRPAPDGVDQAESSTAPNREANQAAGGVIMRLAHHQRHVAILAAGFMASALVYAQAIGPYLTFEGEGPFGRFLKLFLLPITATAIPPHRRQPSLAATAVGRRFHF